MVNIINFNCQNFVLNIFIFTTYIDIDSNAITFIYGSQDNSGKTSGFAFPQGNSNK